MLGMPARGGLFVSAFLAVSVMDQVVMSALAELCYSFRMSGREERDNIGCLIGGFSFAAVMLWRTALHWDAIHVPS